MYPNERSSHPNQAQTEARLQYLEGNPSLAKGFSKVASARDVARKHWVRLAVQLNSMGGSAKTLKHWTKMMGIQETEIPGLRTNLNIYLMVDQAGQIPSTSVCANKRGFHHLLHATYILLQSTGEKEHNLTPTSTHLKEPYKSEFLKSL